VRGRYALFTALFDTLDADAVTFNGNVDFSRLAAAVRRAFVRVANFNVAAWPSASWAKGVAEVLQQAVEACGASRNWLTGADTCVAEEGPDGGLRGPAICTHTHNVAIDDALETLEQLLEQGLRGDTEQAPPACQGLRATTSPRCMHATRARHCLQGRGQPACSLVS
jgi:hypothetical protein